MATSPPIKLVLVGGFLGAGKTTAIVRLAEDAIARGAKVGVIANDQADGLVDTQLYRSEPFDVAQVAGGCFCCRFSDFVTQADSLVRDRSVDVIFAEPVGSCIDLAATVLNPLLRWHHDAFAVAPYTVLVDPLRALKVLGGDERVGLSEKVTYIFRMQQLECDALAISRTDLVDARDLARVRRLLEAHVPGRPIFELSSLTGEGFTEWQAWLDTPTNTNVHHPVQMVDYDTYASGEAELGWLNDYVELEGAVGFDADVALMELAHDLAAACRGSALEVAHVKLMLQHSPSEVAVVQLTSNDTEPIVSRRAANVWHRASLLMNLRVAAPPDILERVARECLVSWTTRWQLTVRGGHRQCFSPPRPVPQHRVIV